MRSLLKHTIFYIICGLTLSQAAVFAQSNPQIDFPVIAGWTKGEITKYPTASAGYSIGYESENDGWIDIYVYNDGKPKIPNGIESQLIKDQFAQAKAALDYYEKQGMYKNVKEVKSAEITLGGTGGKVKSLYSSFNLTSKGTDLTSEIYVFGYKNNFIKIRSSRPREADGSLNKNVAAFLTAIDTLFSK